MQTHYGEGILLPSSQSGGGPGGKGRLPLCFHVLIYRERISATTMRSGPVTLYLKIVLTVKLKYKEHVAWLAQYAEGGAMSF